MFFLFLLQNFTRFIVYPSLYFQTVLVLALLLVGICFMAVFEPLQTLKTNLKIFRITYNSDCLWNQSPLTQVI